MDVLDYYSYYGTGWQQSSGVVVVAVSCVELIVHARATTNAGRFSCCRAVAVGRHLQQAACALPCNIYTRHEEGIWECVVVIVVLAVVLVGVCAYVCVVCVCVWVHECVQCCVCLPARDRKRSRLLSLSLRSWFEFCPARLRGRVLLLVGCDPQAHSVLTTCRVYNNM